MSFISNFLKRCLVVLAAVVAGFSYLEAADAPKVKVKTIRWVMAHNPGNRPVLDLLQNFSRRLEEKSSGTLKIEFVTIKKPNDDLDKVAHRQVASGQAEMSQIKTIELEKYNPEIAALDMPFMFRSYDHADAVLRGSVAQELLDGAYAGSQKKVRGFAFTYSGGYRILHGKVPLNQVSDLKKYKMWERNNHIRQGFLKDLGVISVKEKLARGTYSEPHVSDEIDLNEGELNRLAVQYEQEPATRKFVKFANLTHHNMYLTVLIVNEKFFAGLTPEQQKLLSGEMIELAAAERKLSIDLEQVNRKVLADKGVKLVELAPSEKEKMMAVGEEYHKKHADKLGRVVAKIRAVGAPIEQQASR